MGWGIGYDNNWKRDIGYSVPAFCDHPDCSEKIDRGLGYVCCHEQPYGGDEGCGLFFCAKHDMGGGKCTRCAAGEKPFEMKADHPDWVAWKLVHESWATFREKHPDWVKVNDTPEARARGAAMVAEDA